MGLEPKRIEIIYRDRLVPARKARQVPRWLVIIILTPVLIWAALCLIELEKGQ